MVKKQSDLWQCPKCGQRFTSANQWHSCGSFNLDDLFQHSLPGTRELFGHFVKAVEGFGPVTIIPQKTRIAFQVKMRFAAIVPRKKYLRGHLVLGEIYKEDFFGRINSYSPNNHVHEFRLDSKKQLTPGFVEYIGKAYKVGQRKHLGRK